MIEIKKLKSGEYTEEGSFYALVNGQKVGENGRAFWKTESEAMACAKRYVIAMRMFNGKPP